MAIYGSGRPKKYRQGDSEERKPPKKGGEYRIRNNNDSIIYIGETNNLRRRMNEHKRSGKFSKSCAFEFQVADGRSTSRTRRIHETEKIEKHDPVMNKRGGGGGRVAHKTPVKDV
jgi:excinuclease UvrABC nuclease subunit